MPCELCDSPGGELVWQGPDLRVVLVADPDYPGLCRVIWNRHVAEMTDLDEVDRLRLMRAVFAVESAVRRALVPDKINLASLGNQVPHLHWHVIPRRRDDRHFPHPIWSAPQRPAFPPSREDRVAQLRTVLARELARFA
ncbi:MAG: HIT family protein [Betaproteobacteria bacterium]|nr:HIT family protein [Betaproteobacteria bacterium]